MEEGFVDFGDRVDFFVGVIVYCCVFDCGFGSIVRCE